MLIFIRNTPRDYAWGSRDALPKLLGTEVTGEPQAELWLGAHPGDPADVAKATPEPHTLVDLIAADPARYGVDGGQLPFLMKLLGIGAPLSLQVHPNKAQAEAGYAAEEAAGVPRDARERNYGDPNHKPEVLVALGEVSALCGFRDLGEARRDISALAASAPAGPAAAALGYAAELLDDGQDEAMRDAVAGEARTSFLCWALGENELARQAVLGIAAALAAAENAEAGSEHPAAELVARIGAARFTALQLLCQHHAGDPGVLVSLLLHLVSLQAGEAVYLRARVPHAYLSGVAVEIMAASDNVLRAGLTAKHIDVPEVLRVIDTSTHADPRLAQRSVAAGVEEWQTDVCDFRLLRVRVSSRGVGSVAHDDQLRSDTEVAEDARCAERAIIEAEYPLVLIVLKGHLRVERTAEPFDELVSVGRGQSLYVSAGAAIELSGEADVFIGTVGVGWQGNTPIL